MSQYIDADTIDDIRSAHACGVPLEQLAAQLALAEDDLRRLLGFSRRPIQPDPFDGQPERTAVSDR